MLKNIEYNLLPGHFACADEVFLKKCSDLYSKHYGIWSEKGVRPKQQIKLSANRLCEWLDNDDVTIYYACINDEIIGYAIAFSKKEHGYGIVTWVTQLVVHKDFRHIGIAKNILFSIWGFSNHFAWGIVSANPYAIRALEKATRRRAIPFRIKRNAVKLKNIGKQYVPFINDNTEFQLTENSATINTQFFVDHSDTLKMVANVANENLPWNLGHLDEGWEWFAFTFNDQEQISLSQDEIKQMIDASDSVVQNAYSRMNLVDGKQKWMKNTVSEIDYIDAKVDLSSIGMIYDLGCGTGRHAIELAKRGKTVMGIDYIPQNVQLANKEIEKYSLNNIEIIEGDCRYYTNEHKGSLVICLYDVIGTFSTNEENQKIIKTAYNLLSANGFAVFSVMNYETTLANAENTFTLSESANKLLELIPSHTMEETGNIFNPKHYLVDTDTELVYRREQFSYGKGLPIELIVRDKRFTKDEIVSLCKEVGFIIVEVKYTNASGWETAYEATSSRAKEILIVCQKGENNESN